MKNTQGLADYAAEESTRQALNRALRSLAAAKKGKEELVEAVYRAASDCFAALELKPVAKPPVQKGPGEPEVAVPIIADLQLGKVTPDYNSAVCEARMEHYAEKVRNLTAIQRKDHPVREARVWILGDIIEGLTVFPGQQWLVDSSLYRQIALDGPRILGNFLRSMLADFETVHVTAVIGNHGRLGRRGDFDPETNGDRMVYRITQQMLAGEKRLTWTIPDGMGERHWYAVDRIGNYSCMLVHGDQFGGRMQGALTMIGVKRIANGWRSGAIPEHFQDIAFGHWHQLLEVPLNGKSIARCSGSPESYNTFAQEALAAMSSPSQRLMFVHPGRGMVTAEHKVWLADAPAPKTKRKAA